MNKSISSFWTQFFISFFCLSILYGCSNLKYLPEHEALYTGAEVKLKSADKIADKGKLNDALNAVLVPKPNATVLGLRLRLYLYNKASKTKNTSLKKWLQKKGEPPVLYSSVSPKTTIGLLKNRLFNNGYFYAKVDTHAIHSDRKVKLEYIVTLPKPYTINEVYFPDPANLLASDIQKTKEKSLLKKGDIYNLDVIKSERARIDAELKKSGFFYYNPEYILIRADSSMHNKKLDLYITIKPETPAKAKNKYTLNNIYIDPAYTLEKDSAEKNVPYKLIDNVFYKTGDSVFKPKVIIRTVFLKKGEVYNRELHNLTLKRLIGLSVFKYTNITFKDADSANIPRLDSYIVLTPLPKRSIRLELQAISKSNNYVGPVLIASYRNRNFMRSAGQLVVSLNGGYETQFSKKKAGFNSYEVGGDVKLVMPRFLSPFKIGYESKLFQPKTKIGIGFRFLNRIEYYRVSSFNFNYGYNWKETENKEHELTPVNISYVVLNKASPAFNAILNANPLLKKSFERQFIIGSMYSFTYTNPEKEGNRNKIYFRSNLDVSGNFLNLIEGSVRKEKSTSEKPYTLIGIPYSQYSKVDFDFRYTRELGRHQNLATRFIAGAGVPYGNSQTMPYIKQFFSGGPNSIRAFRTRSVGPGTYNDTAKNKSFTDQAGDMKLELNAEYRFGIFKIIKGAFFADAGNVWLVHENPSLPGGRFNPKTFISELAMGTGFGLRFDVTFFVLRLDLAFPIRKPYLPSDSRWVINQINFGNPSWRGENLILNIAIGYPF
jgi:outer membrane protein insertion porin family